MFQKTWVAAILAPAALIAAAAGCGGGSNDESGRGADLSVQLMEQSASGQTGTAMFTSLDGGRTRIVLELTNPPDVRQPAHVHNGTCDNLGDPVIALTSVEVGRWEADATMSLERLKQGDFVIHAHKSEADYDVSVACAPIEGAGY